MLNDLADKTGGKKNGKDERCSSEGGFRDERISRETHQERYRIPIDY